MYCLWRALLFDTSRLKDWWFRMVQYSWFPRTHVNIVKCAKQCKEMSQVNYVTQEDYILWAACTPTSRKYYSLPWLGYNVVSRKHYTRIWANFKNKFHSNCARIMLAPTIKQLAWRCVHTVGCHQVRNTQALQMAWKAWLKLLWQNTFNQCVLSWNKPSLFAKCYPSTATTRSTLSVTCSIDVRQKIKVLNRKEQTRIALTQINYALSIQIYSVHMPDTTFVIKPFTPWSTCIHLLPRPNRISTLRCAPRPEPLSSCHIN